ncbi:uncharacterized protein MEPE_00506 [Melanopsichium pennsylvanicum]|uniref:Uncharacterized protein n=1 Tax=Melanopsichium pennsylvanicum TaxID=63383 RepID=A0AAJ4XGT8_9BASI|nr:uncharacterized protein MEPE_00506 [Melanopsichium pennsylvanicum]
MNSATIHPDNVVMQWAICCNEFAYAHLHPNFIKTAQTHCNQGKFLRQNGNEDELSLAQGDITQVMLIHPTDCLVYFPPCTLRTSLVQTCNQLQQQQQQDLAHHAPQLANSTHISSMSTLSQKSQG